MDRAVSRFLLSWRRRGSQEGAGTGGQGEDEAEAVQEEAGRRGHGVQMAHVARGQEVKVKLVV